MQSGNQNSPNNMWLNLLIPVALILGLVLLLALNTGPAGQSGELTPLDSWLKMLIGYLVAAAEIAAALVIGTAIVRGLIAYVSQVILHVRPKVDAPESIRLQLGRSLVLGLEFTIASDILRTAVAPTRQDILNLGAIVLLRSLLNYFLEREIRLGEERREAGQERE